ncbi:MAG TPA: FtsW/RodA/SpoVE family cell cycle protein [Anaerolineales bacterium]|nr:FtsW/RodA/SpoVE family cell cycle protein [Anaerolineales bacterium]
MTDPSAPQHALRHAPLPIATLFLGLTAATLSLAPAARLDDWAALTAERVWEPWLIVAVWVLCAWAVSRVLARRLPGHDRLLPQAALFLMGWSALLIWRLLPDYGLRQTAWIVVATAALLLAAATDGILRALRRYRYVMLTLALGLTALTFLIGLDPAETGARLWLGALGVGVFFQPSELLKLTLIAFLAAYLAERRAAAGRLRPIDAVPLIAVWGLTVLVVIAQRDLGAGVLLFGGALAVSYAATGNRRLLVLGVLLLLAAAVAGYAVFGVVRARVSAWLDPFADPIGGAYQIVQALIAQAAGDVLGRGPGLGNANLVPLAHSDFIFSALSEEWGLSGALAMIGLQALLAARGLHAAARAQSAFDRLLAIGLTTLSALQTVLIVGGALRVVPLTGVTLPFVSYGGSSLLTQGLMLGLLIRISDRDRARGPVGLQRSIAARTTHSVPGPEQVAALRTISIAIAAGFAAVALAAGYWGVIRRTELLARPDNARSALLERRYARGPILDREGRVLAESSLIDATYERVYPYPALGPVLGYRSALYGAAGIEAAGDAILHGQSDPDAWTQAGDDFLGEPPRPGALRLTLDLDLQRRVDEALGTQTGAVVVLEIGSGDILALASHPGFDPNTLDDSWRSLTSDPRAPLLNRASTALYQPGTALYPALYALGLQTGLIDQLAEAPGGAAPVAIGAVEFTCATNTPELTWESALLLRCPAPFVWLARELEPERVGQLWRDLGLFAAPAIGLPVVAAVETAATLDPTALLGQGDLTLTPLHYARIVAAWAHAGEVPAPRLIVAQRDPDGGWVDWINADGSVSAFSPASASALQALATRGYASTAIAGAGQDRRSLAWYGVAAPIGQPRFAIAVLLEDAAADEAEAIGQQIAQSFAP